MVILLIGTSILLEMPLQLLLAEPIVLAQAFLDHSGAGWRFTKEPLIVRP